MEKLKNSKKLIIKINQIKKTITIKNKTLRLEDCISNIYTPISPKNQTILALNYNPKDKSNRLPLFKDLQEIRKSLNPNTNISANYELKTKYNDRITITGDFIINYEKD